MVQAAEPHDVHRLVIVWVVRLRIERAAFLARLLNDQATL
jgi:hypothetical protein